MTATPREDIAYTELGHGLRYTFAAWTPDRALNPQWSHLPDVDRYQLWLEHQCGEQRVMFGCVLDGPVSRVLDPDRPRWTVTSWEPLTLHPSILCLTCRIHGWIQDGVWEPG